MDKIESLEEFYKRKFNWIPDNLRNELEPLSGKILWEYKDWICHISVPSAVDAGNNKVIVVGGYEHGTVMLKVEKKGDGSYSVTELYKHNDFGDHTKPPILHNG